MTTHSRRDFLGSGGLALSGLGALTLPIGERPTATSGDEDIDALLAPQGKQGSRRDRKVTEDNILGPYFRPGIPYVGKVTPPLAPGKVLVIRGRVWGVDTRKPIPGAQLHIWQADARGRYDNDDPKAPPKPGVFAYRTRLVTDERGHYEFESIHPGRYKTGPDTMRPAHIHYKVEAPGYATLITQLYFRGDPQNATDAFIKDSLIIDLETVTIDARRRYQRGVFDIVLAKQS